MGNYWSFTDIETALCVDPMLTAAKGASAVSVTMDT